MTTTLDSYSEANRDDYFALDAAYPSAGGAIYQSFQTPNNGITYKLEKVQFYIGKWTFTGTVQAEIYTHDGTFGTSSLPTGAALATSAELDQDDLTNEAYTLEDFAFSGDGQINLEPNTYYVVALKCTANSGGEVRVGTDSSAPGHSGNMGTWDT